MNEARTNRAASARRELVNERVSDTPAQRQRAAGSTSARRGVPEHMCGQRALSFACGLSLDAVVGAIGHCGPLSVREIRTFFERHTKFRPTELAREALAARPAEIWWSFGARRFLAVLVQFDAGRSDGMGHAFVLEGRTLLDPDSTSGDIKQRVRPDALGRYDYAFILSAAEVSGE